MPNHDFLEDDFFCFRCAHLNAFEYSTISRYVTSLGFLPILLAMHCFWEGPSVDWKDSYIFIAMLLKQTNILFFNTSSYAISTFV